MILKSEDVSNKSFILGGGFTTKWLVWRILCSLLIGIGALPFASWMGTIQFSIDAWVFSATLVTIATYFIGFPWALIPLLRKEKEGKKS